LSRFNRAAGRRELRMIELKKKVNDLCEGLGQPPRYPLEFEETKRFLPSEAPTSDGVRAAQPAEERVQKRNQRLALLSESLGHLVSSHDPERIVRDLFPKVAAHLGVDTYFNYMVNREGDALTLHSYAGISNETAKAIERLEFGQAICGRVAQTHQPIVAMEIQTSDYDKAALVRSCGIQAYACNPLMSGGRFLGTLSFASRTRARFDEDELEFIRTVSR
jgi:GAF domain-containing protein